MARVGDKFIIEIETVYGGYASTDGTDIDKIPNELYRIKGFNSLVFDQNGIEKLQKYEPELTQEDLKKERQAGREEAWECARNIVLTSGLKSYELEKIFGNINSEHVLRKFSADEAIQKIKSYEEQKKAEEEIKVGDEVEYKGNKMMVVSLENGGVTVIDDSGELWIVNAFETAKKTGRHFSQLQEIFDQMREG